MRFQYFQGFKTDWTKVKLAYNSQEYLCGQGGRTKKKKKHTDRVEIKQRYEQGKKGFSLDKLKQRIKTIF